MDTAYSLFAVVVHVGSGPHHGGLRATSGSSSQPGQTAFQHRERSCGSDPPHLALDVGGDVTFDLRWSGSRRPWEQSEKQQRCSAVLF